MRHNTVMNFAFADKFIFFSYIIDKILSVANIDYPVKDFDYTFNI